MVEVGMLEIALVGAGLVVGYVLGKMNGSSAREYTNTKTITKDSHNQSTSTDNRGANHAGGNIATDKSKQNN